MKISELVTSLNKVSQVANDIDIVLRDAETGTVTDIESLDLSFDPATAATDSVLYVVHDTPVTPVVPPDAGPPADTTSSAPPTVS